MYLKNTNTFSLRASLFVIYSACACEELCNNCILLMYLYMSMPVCVCGKCMMYLCGCMWTWVRVDMCVDLAWSWCWVSFLNFPSLYMLKQGFLMNPKLPNSSSDANFISSEPFFQTPIHPSYRLFFTPTFLFTICVILCLSPYLSVNPQSFKSTKYNILGKQKCIFSLGGNNPNTNIGSASNSLRIDRA